MNGTTSLTHGDVLLSLKDWSHFWKRKILKPQILENSLDTYFSITVFMHLTPIDFTELSLKLFLKLSTSKLTRKAKTTRRKHHYRYFTNGEPRQRTIKYFAQTHTRNVTKAKNWSFPARFFFPFLNTTSSAFFSPIKHDLANNSNLPLPVSQLLNFLFSSLVVCMFSHNFSIIIFTAVFYRQEKHKL